MVGGHCIGVDPFYLAHLATSIGHRPEVILAGRRINETMPGYIADQIAERIAAAERPAVASRILVLGLTFKENVPDLRNSKVASLVNRLRDHGYRVDIHDPLADPGRSRRTLRHRPAPDAGNRRALRLRRRRGAPHGVSHPDRRRADPPGPPRRAGGRHQRHVA